MSLWCYQRREYPHINWTSFASQYINLMFSKLSREPPSLQSLLSQFDVPTVSSITDSSFKKKKRCHRPSLVTIFEIEPFLHPYWYCDFDFVSLYWYLIQAVPTISCNLDSHPLEMILQICLFFNWDVTIANISNLFERSLRP